ncbi:MAG: hypothetical protein H7245_09165 [Candidatus Saccharibacteria bacterium]|nr:hypothetical protein [Pseudorhodobacter sp.]
MLSENKTVPARQGVIRLPSQRLLQLRALADTWQLTLADTIGRLIAGEVAKGTIPDAIADVTVAREGDVILIAFDQGEPMSLSLDQAAHVAAQIRLRMEGSDLRQAMQVQVDAQRRDFGLRPFYIARKGRGISVRLGNQVKDFALGVAQDFAALIEKAAAERMGEASETNEEQDL